MYIYMVQSNNDQKLQYCLMGMARDKFSGTVFVAELRQGVVEVIATT